MDSRKYFKYRIAELEAVYEEASGDCALLEELEEELSHRSTQRAKKLLLAVQKSLHGSDTTCSYKTTNQTPPIGKQASEDDQPSRATEEPVIDWGMVMTQDSGEFDTEHKEAPLREFANKPTDILDTWTALEALSPQTYKRPTDLVFGFGSVAHLKSGQEPWIKGEKSRPKNSLYYAIYLGAIDMERATTQLLSVYQDYRVERPSMGGLAALGVVLVDKHGIPIPDNGLALSSFGWAYARALQGRLNDLSAWEAAEEALKKGLENLIYEQDQDGNVAPFSLKKAEQVYRWLIKNCEIPEVDSKPPSFATRIFQPFSKGEPEAPLLNSFFLNDLQRVRHAVGTNQIGHGLSQYLGISQPEQLYDVLAEKHHLEQALEPRYMPLSRWPSQGRHALVLLQQAAVNHASKELKKDGLFSVNGPPGTGKTTLLRDIVASVLLERSKALCAFQNPDDAFEHAGKMKLGNGFVHMYKLNDSLQGHEIVVASTNNGAVENVSKELPLREQIADDIEDFSYFNVISDALAEDGSETWGLIASVLGNSKNKSRFINTAWWDNNVGLKQYFLYITGQRNFGIDDEGNEIVPKIIEQCDPPESLEEAKQRWRSARHEFQAALKEADDARSDAQRCYEATLAIRNAEDELSKNRTLQAQTETKIQATQAEIKSLSETLIKLNHNLAQLENEKTQTYKSKPWFWKRWFSRVEWKAWSHKLSAIENRLETQTGKHSSVKRHYESTQNTLKGCQTTLAALGEKSHALTSKIQTLSTIIESLTSTCGGKLITSDLWNKNHKEQQTFTPNFTDKANRLRDDVFIASVKLHKAFIDASAKQIRQNLGAYFYSLGGGPLPQDKQALLPHLWSTAFLLSPVMSTAFASVGRMLKGMPKESIGWLLIDEAGQAAPQAAVGAIYRAKRIISVGDPLQIEPVVTLPPTIVEGISKYIGVDPFQWAAPDASVQSVSDNANIYGTTIPRDLSEIRIGLPLLVHRRCEDPMFSISNKLAYNGLMVHAKESTESTISEVFGTQTRWFDIRGGAEEKWCPAEGNHVCDMLLRACDSIGGEPDIFVITPFRKVAHRMRQRMKIEENKLRESGMTDPAIWIDDNIGTVHTFQGKEAKAVILLLGAPSPSQTGARSWATSNVNLLNVAVSRAKQNFYVVGNRELWGELGHMKLISRYVK